MNTACQPAHHRAWQQSIGQWLPNCAHHHCTLMTTSIFVVVVAGLCQFRWMAACFDYDHSSTAFIVSTGCSCHFLYGPETKDEHKQQIEKSLMNKTELKLEVIFYKKDGKYTLLLKILIFLMYLNRILKSK